MKRLPVSVIAVTSLTLLWAAAASACGRDGYTYAGFFSPLPATGIAATITPLSPFAVSSGHVGAWVGVGGPGRGPGGQDEWLQVGLSALPDVDGNQLYYELAFPGSDPSYHELGRSLPAGRSARVAVLELPNQPSFWRVWVNGSPASPPIHLPASHRRLWPTATAESWDGGTGGPCNAFLYRFNHTTIRRRNWEPLGGGYPVDDENIRVHLLGSGAFRAAEDLHATTR